MSTIITDRFGETGGSGRYFGARYFRARYFRATFGRIIFVRTTETDRFTGTPVSTATNRF